MKTSSKMSGQRGFYNFTIGLPIMALYGIVTAALLSDDSSKDAPTLTGQTEVQLSQASTPDAPIKSSIASSVSDCGNSCGNADMSLRLDP